MAKNPLSGTKGGGVLHLKEKIYGKAVEIMGDESSSRTLNTRYP